MTKLLYEDLADAKQYEALGRSGQLTRPQMWLARYSLELPLGQKFICQDIRHALAPLVSLDFCMPDMNMAVHGFLRKGMLDRVRKTRSAGNRKILRYSQSQCWDEYVSLLIEHYNRS